MKVVQLLEKTPKQHLNLNPTPKLAQDPKIKSKSIVIMEENIENKSCSTT